MPKCANIIDKKDWKTVHEKLGFPCLNIKFELLGSIRNIRNLENHLQNSIWAIYLLAMGLRVQPLKEIGHNFATFTCLTKIPLTLMKINGFSNFQVLLLLETYTSFL